MRNIYYFISTISIIFLLTASCQSGDKQHVLVIHSYENDYPGYPEYNRLIKKEFSKLNKSVDISYFYLDCESYNEPEEIQRINHLLDSLSNWKPDIILVYEDQATYSLLKTYHPILKQTPIVFAGVNYPNWGLIRQFTNITGFHDKIDICKNLKMIKRLTGKKNIYTILDFTFLDRKIREDIDYQLSQTSIISNLDWHLNKQIIKAECKKGNIIFSALSARSPSKNWSEEHSAGADFLWAISKYSTMPYLQTKLDYTTVTMASFSTKLRFTAINELFDCGYNFLGGYMTPINIQVKESVTTATSILNGKNIKQIPIQESAKKYLIDWNIMQKENLKLKDIPAEYTIINIPFKVQHPIIWWSNLIGSILILFFILFFITYLYLRETKRKRNVLYQLEDERESLALAVEGSDTYAWRLKNNMMIFENAFWKNIGLKPHPLEIQEFISFVDSEYKHTIQSLLSGRIINGKHFVKLRCDFNGKGYQWWELRCSTMDSLLGEQKTTGLLLNIEDYKKREEELIEARKLAEKAELKESFLANMSHEIRTPLNAIVGFSNLLTSSDADISQEDKEQYIEIINLNNELLLKLINDILEISRIESGYMSFTYEDCEVRALVNDVYLTHKVLIPKELDFQLEEDTCDLIVHIDRNRMVQVLTNFLNNASKFTAKGYIKLGWHYIPEEEVVEIFVEDSGIGISNAEQQMIFSRFYKQNEFAQGTGLGLSICKVIVEKLHGHLSLKSEEGVGSRFSVFFSCKQVSPTDVNK